MLKLEGGYFSKGFSYWVWLLMAFQAGYVNVGGFFESGNFVSHVTGTSSQIGMGIAQLDPVMLSTFIVVLLAFIIGAGFAGYQIGFKQEVGQEPRYVLVLAVKSLFFGLILLLSEVDLIESSKDAINKAHLLLIFFLSFCCGVQNATCSLATGGFLKPTHMTGLSTDIGLMFTKILAWDRKSDRYKTEMRKSWTRVSILASFIFGGAVAASIFSYNGHYGFLFPFLSSLCFLMVGMIQGNESEYSHSWAFKAAKSSIVVTFVVTLVFGINACVSLV
ncbi:MAG: hypothetical protein CL678_01380 [Bdellovibrionaceae bacterium]|nr:hypothetical protein [Pseudobdellovibrionaceae bacterium]|tara:strand:- start:3276 stop:4103 length:828 start_codon:yes stop_codon:yes gene_type:complete